MRRGVGVTLRLLFRLGCILGILGGVGNPSRGGKMSELSDLNRVLGYFGILNSLL